MLKKAFLFFCNYFIKEVISLKAKEKNPPELFILDKSEKAHKHSGDELWKFTKGSGWIIIGFRYEAIVLDKEYFILAGVDHCIIVSDKLNCTRIRFRNSNSFKTQFKDEDDERCFNRLAEGMILAGEKNKEKKPEKRYIAIVRK